jgi:putative flippase GtrA
LRRGQRPRTSGKRRIGMAGKGNKGWLPQLVMFGMIGVLNTLVDFGMFALLTWLSLHYAVAQTLAYLAGMANSYLLNNAITFRSQRRESSRSTGAALRRQLRFLVWNGVMLLLSIGMLSGAVQLLGWSAWLGKIVVTIFILGLNFYGSKRWVFAGDRSKKAVEPG